MKSAEEIEFLWKKYEKYCHKLDDENINKMIEELGERLIFSSYNLKSNEPYCGEGSLLEFCIDYCEEIKNISKLFEYNQVDTKSMLFAGLFSDIGRIGTETCPRLVKQTSSWHKEKLYQEYAWNEECDKYSVTHMSLYYLHKYNIKMSWEQFLSIQLSQGMHLDENKFYINHNPDLAIYMQMARESLFLKKNKQFKISNI